jgi:hypothetical protein
MKPHSPRFEVVKGSNLFVVADTKGQWRSSPTKSHQAAIRQAKRLNARFFEGPCECCNANHMDRRSMEKIVDKR